VFILKKEALSLIAQHHKKVEGGIPLSIIIIFQSYSKTDFLTCWECNLVEEFLPNSVDGYQILQKIL
jgi:hypothetical protein